MDTDLTEEVAEDQPSGGSVTDANISQTNTYRPLIPGTRNVNKHKSSHSVTDKMYWQQELDKLDNPEYRALCQRKLNESTGKVITHLGKALNTIARLH